MRLRLSPAYIGDHALSWLHSGMDAAVFRWEMSPAAAAGSVAYRNCSQVTNALSRARKEETVETLKSKLNESLVVFGMRHKGMSVSAIGPLLSLLGAI